MAEVRKNRILVGVEEAMEALSIGRSKLLELTYSGELKTVKIGRRRLYSLDGLHDWVRAKIEGR
jgi:excisionase family DNA binding protein